MARLNADALEALKLVRSYLSADNQPAKAAALAELASLVSSSSWLRSIKGASVRKDGEAVTVTYAKPKALPEETTPGKTTYRIYDVEAFLMQLVLLSFGGGTSMEATGRQRETPASVRGGRAFYPRLNMGKIRPMVTRLIVDAPESKGTCKFKDYHELLVASFQGFFEADLDDPERNVLQKGAYVGRRGAKASRLT